MICLSDYHEGSCHFSVLVSVLFNSFLIKNRERNPGFYFFFQFSQESLQIYEIILAVFFIFIFRIAGFLPS